MCNIYHAPTSNDKKGFLFGFFSTLFFIMLFSLLNSGCYSAGIKKIERHQNAKDILVICKSPDWLTERMVLEGVLTLPIDRLPLISHEDENCELNTNRITIYNGKLKLEKEDVGAALPFIKDGKITGALISFKNDEELRIVAKYTEVNDELKKNIFAHEVAHAYGWLHANERKRHLMATHIYFLNSNIEGMK